jgi:hypothetical protein
MADAINVQPFFQTSLLSHPSFPLSTHDSSYTTSIRDTTSLQLIIFILRNFEISLPLYVNITAHL